MALRVLLVAFVAALGLELPGADELAGYARSGRGWMAARIAELSSFRNEDATADLPPEAAPGRVDLAFEAVSEAMASGFAADLALLRSKPLVEGKLASAESQTDPTPEVSETPAVQESRLDRIATAVRLTKQAVDAWASLVQPTADRVVVEENGDSF